MEVRKDNAERSSKYLGGTPQQKEPLSLSLQGCKSVAAALQKPTLAPTIMSLEN